MADDALFCEKCGAIIASRARTGQKVTEERDAAEEADRTEPAFQRAAEEADRTEAGSGRTAKEANQMSVESASPQGKTEWADAALQEADKAAEQGTDANIGQPQEHMPQAEPERASYPPKNMPQTGPEQVSQPQEHMPQTGPEQAGMPQNPPNPSSKKKRHASCDHRRLHSDCGSHRGSCSDGRTGKAAYKSGSDVPEQL